MALRTISFKIPSTCSNTLVFFFLAINLPCSSLLLSRSPKSKSSFGLKVKISTLGITIGSLISTYFSYFIFFDFPLEIYAFFATDCVEVSFVLSCFYFFFSYYFFSSFFSYFSSFSSSYFSFTFSFSYSFFCLVVLVGVINSWFWPYLVSFFVVFSVSLVLVSYDGLVGR